MHVCCACVCCGQPQPALSPPPRLPLPQQPAAMPAPRSRPAAAAAALLLLAALLAPAAAVDCAGTLDKAMALCKREMVDIVFAVQAGAEFDAAWLSPSAGCCAAAAAVFDPAFMSACGCGAAALQNAVTTTPAALAALKDATAAKCKPAGPLVGFPACPAPSIAAAAKTAGVSYNAPAVGTAGISAADANATNTTDPALIPKAGHGSKCYVGQDKACTTKCTSKGAADVAYTKALQKCRSTTAKGFCAGGFSRCGNNVTDNAELFTQVRIVHVEDWPLCPTSLALVPRTRLRSRLAARRSRGGRALAQAGRHARAPRLLASLALARRDGCRRRCTTLIASVFTLL